MAQGVFPIVGARQELGFTPTRAVRANIDVRTGDVGAAIGQGVVQLAGLALKKKKRQDENRRRIEEKRRQMQDANSAVVANKLRDTATTEFETFKLTNPQETWEQFRIKQTEEVATQIGELDFSPDAAETQRVKSEAYTSVETAKSLTQATRQLREDTIAAQTKAMTEAFRSGDMARIAEASRRFADNGANMGKDKAEVLSDIKIAKEAGEKLRKQDTLDGWQDRIAENPVTTEQVLEGELAARKQNKGVISEDELTSSDIQSLLNTATNRKSQLLADTQAAVNKKNKELETKLHDDISSGDASITDIQNSDLPAPNKRRLEKDLGDIAKRNVNRMWAIQDTPLVSSKVNAMLNDIESGIVDINESRTALSALANEKTKDGRSIVSKATFDKTMAQFKTDGRDAVDIFTGEQAAKVENFLIARLNARQARLTVRSEARTLTNKERRQFSTTGFLIQVANHQLLLYKESLANRLRTLGIEDTSGKEAKAEAVKIWDSIKVKPASQRFNDFLSASGQKLVRPFGFPANTWETADGRDKAAIVLGVSKGFDNDIILELLNK